jgi:type IV secretory pathway ATPase VirB11/archaellum biosynthesis ATPase
MNKPEIQLRPGDRTLLHLLRPIDEALNHPEVTDIVVNQPLCVGIRRAGRWEWLDVPSFDFETLDAATILIGQRTGREFDEANPYVNSTLPGGQRFQGVRPPGTKADRILWAIRRPPATARKMEDPDFPGLFATTNKGQTRRQRVRQQLMDLHQAGDWQRFFPAARMAGLSMAFCGATGSGKSDMARRMIQISRPGARMVTIETDDEFGDVGPENKAPLFYDDTRISSDEAVRIALRLVPVEIALQEVRGAEAYALLRAMSSGHSGVTTWHAEEGRELEALAMMARQHPAGREMSEGRLMEMASEAFGVIAYCERSDDGFRVSSVRLMAEEREAA